MTLTSSKPETQARTPQAPERLRWFKYVKPYLPWFIIGPLCMIVEVIGEVVMPKLLAYIIDFGVKHTMDLCFVIICTVTEQVFREPFLPEPAIHR